MAVRDPILSPEVHNRIAEAVTEHFESSFRLLMQSLYPQGYIAGQTPYGNTIQDKVEELTALMMAHDQSLSVAADPNALPGDRTRANNELLREQELRIELFNA